MIRQAASIASAFTFFTAALWAGTPLAAPGGSATTSPAAGQLPGRALAVDGDLDITQNIQTLHMAGRLQALSQTMTKHALLMALASEPGRSLEALAAESQDFNRIITGLRHGDADLGLPTMSHPKILKRLARLEREWSIFGPVVRRIVARGKVTPKDVAIVAECIDPLASATRKLIDEVQYYATGGRTFSLRTRMISRTEDQRALIHEIVAGTLLIAYGHQPDAYRAKLKEQQARFDQTLKGLMRGDSGLQLLAAPTWPLQQRFRAALDLWARLSPVLNRVAEGEAVPEGEIATLLKASHQLAVELELAVELYRSI